MASNTEIKSLVDEITTLESSLSKNGTNESEGQRRALRAAVKKLGFALESPFETLDRTVLGVSSFGSMIFLAWGKTNLCDLSSLYMLQLFGSQ